MRRMDRPPIWIDPLSFWTDQSQAGMSDWKLGKPLSLSRPARRSSCLIRAVRPCGLTPAPSVTPYCWHGDQKRYCTGSLLLATRPADLGMPSMQGRSCAATSCDPHSSSPSKALSRVRNEAIYDRMGEGSLANVFTVWAAWPFRREHTCASPGHQGCHYITL